MIQVSSRVNSLWTVGWKISLYFLIWATFMAPFMMSLDHFIPESGRNDWTYRLCADLFGLPSLILTSWLMLKFVDKRPLVSLGFQFKNSIRDLIVGTIAGAAQLLSAVAICLPFGYIFMSDSVSGLLLLVMGISILFNAAEQEILTRGYMLQTIRSKFGARSALGWSSVLFMLMHAGVLVDGAILPAINLFLAGILFGIAYLYTNNLWLPIGLHFGWNYTIGPVLGLTLSGQDIRGQWQLLELHGPSWIAGGDFGPEGGLAATVAVVAGILILVFLSRRKQESAVSF